MENEKGIIKFDAVGGEVVLTKETVKKYLVSGDESKVTDQELVMFMQLCKYQKLNPWLKEAYIIKYGNYPATLVTGKEAYLKRAKKNDKYQGHEVEINGEGDDMTATARVHVEGYKVPVTVTVDYLEYVGLKDGKPNKQWKAKPKTMLKKVALSQALREAFPENLGGMYTEAEGHAIVQDEPIDITPSKTSSVQPAKDETETKASTTDKKKATKEQEKLYVALSEYCKGDPEKMKATLKDVTSFPASKDMGQLKKGDMVPGKIDVYKVSEKACPVARHKIEEMMKAAGDTPDPENTGGACPQCEWNDGCTIKDKREEGKPCDQFQEISG